MYKKFRYLFLIILSASILFFTGAIKPAGAAPPQSDKAPAVPEINARFKIGQTSYTLNGRDMSMDAAPFIKEGRTYVPVRYVAGAAGIPPENISFKDGVVTIKWGDVSAALTPGSNVVAIGNLSLEMDVPVLVLDGRTYVPLRWVCGAFNLNVGWDGENREIIIQTKSP